MVKMQVTLPPGVVAGQVIQLKAPSGQTVQVAVPQGVPPGGQFLVSVPA
jgi:hypothetical protein